MPPCGNYADVRNRDDFGYLRRRRPNFGAVLPTNLGSGKKISGAPYPFIFRPGLLAESSTSRSIRLVLS